MATYKVGWFAGSLSATSISIDRPLARAPMRLAAPERSCLMGRHAVIVRVLTVLPRQA